MPMSTASLIAYIGIVTALTMSPGSTTLLIARNVIAHGKRAALFVILGGGLAIFVDAAASALGVSLILSRSPALFTVVKLLGALYLIFLGIRAVWQALRQRPAEGLPAAQATTATDKPASEAFTEGLMTVLLSPTAAIFYLAMLPQFVSPGQSVLLQVFILASIHFVIRFFYYSALALFLDRLTGLLRNARVWKWVELGSGALLVVWGLRVALIRG